MSLENPIIRKVSGITPEQEEEIIAYLRKAVDDWCKKEKDRWFAARDFLGGKHSDWEGTPMYVLYKKSRNAKKAGIEAGWLLKKTIHKHPSKFESKTIFVKHYRMKK